MSFQLTYDAIAKRIDHSLLGPTLDHAELEEGCRLAARYGVASVCIKPYAVALAARILEGLGRRGRDDRSGSRTAAMRRPSRSSKPSRPWPTGRPSSTWSSTSARRSAASGTRSPPTSPP